MGKIWRWVFFYALTIGITLLGAFAGSRCVTVMAHREPPERKYCVVIDPGHGGEDGGAVSASGLPESGYNLDISIRLQDLMHLLGYGTKLIRREDVSVYTEGKSLAEKKRSDLKTRVRLVEETDSAVLLSIHQNHFPDPQYRGAQVFYAATEGSEALAGEIQSRLNASLCSGSRRQIKKAAGVYLMEHIRCPGVLIECGFLSNRQEEEKLRNPEYQKQLGAVIAVAVSKFLSNT